MCEIFGRFNRVNTCGMRGHWGRGPLWGILGVMDPPSKSRMETAHDNGTFRLRFPLSWAFTSCLHVGLDVGTPNVGARERGDPKQKDLCKVSWGYILIRNSYTDHSLFLYIGLSPDIPHLQLLQGLFHTIHVGSCRCPVRDPWGMGSHVRV